jgi:hypothetical protein
MAPFFSFGYMLRDLIGGSLKEDSDMSLCGKNMRNSPQWYLRHGKKREKHTVYMIFNIN